MSLFANCRIRHASRLCPASSLLGSWLLALGSTGQPEQLLTSRTHTIPKIDRHQQVRQWINPGSMAFGFIFSCSSAMVHPTGFVETKGSRRSLARPTARTRDARTHAFMPNNVLDLAKRIESARKLKQNWFFLGQTGSWRFHPRLLATHLCKTAAQYEGRMPSACSSLWCF